MFFRFLISTLLPFCVVVSAGAETIQFDVRAVLTGRSVTTLTQGKLVPWTLGVDGGGKADGIMTTEAAAANGDSTVIALPGNGFFAATANRPEIQLNYSNADGVSPQTASIDKKLGFGVPAFRYSRILVFLTSAEGESKLKVTLTYRDGFRESREYLVPDYYNAAPSKHPNMINLASDLAKWDSTGRLAERDHHYIHGLVLHPHEHRVLTRIDLEKVTPSFLVFWGATGIYSRAKEL